MHFTAVFALTTALLGLASATDDSDPLAAMQLAGIVDFAPGGADNSATNKRDGNWTGPWGGLYFCTDRDWKGQCLRTGVPLDNSCLNILPGNPFFKTISAIGPDRGTVCDLYVGPQCYSLNGESMYKDVVYPGYSDLSDWKLDLKLDDMIGSFKCRQG